jgi:hypothetical protein
MQRLAATAAAMIASIMEDIAALWLPSAPSSPPLRFAMARFHFRGSHSCP